MIGEEKRPIDSNNWLIFDVNRLKTISHCWLLNLDIELVELEVRKKGEGKDTHLSLLRLVGKASEVYVWF